MNPQHYRSAQMPVERRKVAGALLASVINGEQPWSVVVKQYNNADAYRRIPGETGAARLARINREVAAGASSTRRPALR